MHRTRVLAVEDDATIRRIYVGALSEEHDVITVDEAREALDLLGRRRFDAVLLDLHLDGPVDGKELYRRIAARHPRLAARVIVCTGDSSSRETAEFLVATGCATLWKPFDLEVLRRMVRDVAAGSGEAGACHALPPVPAAG